MKLKTWMKEHKIALMIVGGTIVGAVVGGTVVKAIDCHETTNMLCELFDGQVGYGGADSWVAWLQIDEGRTRFGKLANFDKMLDPNRVPID